MSARLRLTCIFRTEEDEGAMAFQDPSAIKLHLRAMSDGNPHPSASTATLHPISDFTLEYPRPTTALALRGSHVVLHRSGYSLGETMSVLHIWNWRSGAIILVRELSASECTYVLKVTFSTWSRSVSHHFHSSAMNPSVCSDATRTIGTPPR